MDGRPEDISRGPSPRLSFVNVTFPGELPLLRLQARSMSRYLPVSLVEEVINIVNATNEAAARDELEGLRAEYGPLAPKVRNVTASEVFAAGPNRTGLRHLPKALVARNPWLYGRRRAGWRGNDGWQMQQALKLAAARVTTADTIVILDSKNIFVAPLRVEDFVAGNGKPLARFDRGKSQLSMRWLPASLKALGLDPRIASERPILSILTPAVVKRRLVCDLLDALEARQGPVQNLFAMPWNRVTEFMLITAWCLKDGGLARSFEDGAIDPWNLNSGHDDGLRLRHVAGAATGKLVTPHRIVMTQLSPELRAALLALLSERGLLAGAEEFDGIVDDLRRRNLTRSHA